MPWPPIVFACAVVAALLLGHVLPTDGIVPSGSIIRGLAAAVMLAGLGLDLAAMREMRRAHADILHHRAATALVTGGPFKLSRNPIYLGNTIMVAAAAFAFGNPWFIPAAVTAALSVSMLAIKREEAHLAARFGDAWTAYAERTARWVGLLPW